jgi:PLP dependent protein
VKENFQKVSRNITSACDTVKRDHQDVNIIAVTKYVSLQTAEEALEAGINHLGESRVEGFLSKYEALKDRATFHFIGSLQSRKVKDVINHVDFLHSLERLSLAKEIQKRANKKVRCFVQVNVSGEESKSGLSVEEVEKFILQLETYTSIEVVGLMTMAPQTEDKELIRSVFKKLRILQQSVQALNLPFAPCKHLSMGMSNDYEIAIEEGATFVRIGSALVGNT